MFESKSCLKQCVNSTQLSRLITETSLDFKNFYVKDKDRFYIFLRYKGANNLQPYQIFNNKKNTPHVENFNTTCVQLTKKDLF